MSQAYSIHTFAGMLGSAAAPGAVLFMHGLYGWRGAFLGAAVLGVVAALVLLFTPGGDAHHPAGKPARRSTGPTDWRLLLTAPILMNFVFFMIYAFGSFGLQNFSVVALGELYGTSPVDRQHRAVRLSAAERARRAGRRLDRRPHDPSPPHRRARALGAPCSPRC